MSRKRVGGVPELLVLWRCLQLQRSASRFVTRGGLLKSTGILSHFLTQSLSHFLTQSLSHFLTQSGACAASQGIRLCTYVLSRALLSAMASGALSLWQLHACA